MSFWCLPISPKKRTKKKSTWGIKFICSFFGRNVGLKKSFPLCLTFNSYCIILSFLSISKTDHIKLNSSNIYWFSPRMISELNSHFWTTVRRPGGNKRITWPWSFWELSWSFLYATRQEISAIWLRLFT